MRLRPALHALLLTSVAGSLVVGAAAPGLAAGADRKTYKASIGSTTGSVTASFGGLELVDYLAGKYQDRLIGSAPKGAAVKVGGQTCKSSSLRLNGHDGMDWANVPDGATQKGNFQLTCTYLDGSTHRFWWGVTHLGGWSFESTDCLSVTRRDGGTTTTYEVTTAMPSGTHCPAQEELLDKAHNVKDSWSGLHLPFTATFTVAGIVPSSAA